MTHLTSTMPHEALFSALRRTEFSRIDQNGQVYLDYTGGNLYPQSQIMIHHNMLCNEILGNPHSTNPSSQRSTEKVEATRRKVIEFFNADDYFCIFTQNATGALKIVGECYPFNESSYYLALADNHNSVNGIREFCLHKGGHYEYCPIHYEDLRIDGERLEELLSAHPDAHDKLFAFPAQSNVSGVKHDLGWIKKRQIRVGMCCWMQQHLYPPPASTCRNTSPISYRCHFTRFSAIQQELDACW